jgi:hypothetical protein
MGKKLYPDEAVVFEVIALSEDAEDLSVGDHVEGAGPCCLGSDNEGVCGILTLNGCTAEDSYQWIRNLRPLTHAAEAMRAALSRFRFAWRTPARRRFS